MLKKVIIIFIVFLLCFSFSITTFAIDYEPSNTINDGTSAYDPNTTGINLLSVGGIQYLRGALTKDNGNNINTTLNVGYYDLEHGTTFQQMFAPAFIWEDYGSDVAFRYTFMRYNNPYGTTSIPKNTKMFIHFSLYFEDLNGIDDLEFYIQSVTGGVSIGGSGSAVWDNKNGFKYVGTCMDDYVTNRKLIKVKSKESCSNYLTFRVPITLVSNVESKKVDLAGSSGKPEIFDFVFLTSAFNVKSTNEKKEIENSANSSKNDSDNALSDDKGGSITDSFGTLANAMSYNGTNAKLSIPSFTWGLGNIIPERTWFEGADIDFGAYINQFVPESILILIRSLTTIGIVVFCFKELYDLISLVLVNKKAGDD